MGASFPLARMISGVLMQIWISIRGDAVYRLTEPGRHDPPKAASAW